MNKALRISSKKIKIKKNKEVIYLSRKRPLVFLIPVSSVYMGKHRKQTVFFCVFFFSLSHYHKLCDIVDSGLE